MRLFPGKRKRGHASSKNTCLRLYLAWLEHNQESKIAGPAPALRPRAPRAPPLAPPAAKFSHGACVNHAPQCVSPRPASERSSLARVLKSFRTLSLAATDLRRLAKPRRLLLIDYLARSPQPLFFPPALPLYSVHLSHANTPNSTARNSSLNLTHLTYSPTKTVEQCVRMEPRWCH